MIVSRQRASLGCDDTAPPRVVAVAGATGFVGRALAPALVRAGYSVRRLARHPASLDALDGVDDCRFDLDDASSQQDCLRGVDTAFYLVHAMAAGDGFAERDRRYAERFAAAAIAAGVRHVIYLGGLHPSDAVLSEHLRSRREVGDILRTRCGALHIRAGIIIGSGSASFEIMRDLVRRLPVMVTPRWVRNRCQTVDIGDVVAALIGAIDVPGNREVDLAGPDTLTYRRMLVRLAQLMGRRRPVILDVPVITPGLSAHWLRFVTSVSLPVAHALVHSLRHDALADGADLFAELGLRPCGFDEAVRRALAPFASVVRADVQCGWSGSRYNLCQRWELTTGARLDRQFLDRVDTTLRETTRSATLHALRWRGNDLRLGPLSLIRLGGATHSGIADELVISRRILGGALTASGTGSLSVHGVTRDRLPVLEVQLTGYRPRLPRVLYLGVQEPFHRALVRRSVRKAIRRGGDHGHAGAHV